MVAHTVTYLYSTAAESLSSVAKFCNITYLYLNILRAFINVYKSLFDRRPSKTSFSLISFICILSLHYPLFILKKTLWLYYDHNLAVSCFMHKS